jgi:serine/threonine-protein kinase RsbW
LGAQLNFTLDDIEDLRMAVDELCSALIEANTDPKGALTVQFRLDTDRLHMEAVVPAAYGQPPFTIDEISTHILRAAVDHHEVEQNAECLVARMTKQCVTTTS